MNNDAKPGIPEDLAEQYRFAVENAQGDLYADIVVLIERIAAVEAELKAAQTEVERITIWNKQMIDLACDIRMESYVAAHDADVRRKALEEAMVAVKSYREKCNIRAIDKGKP